MSQQLRFDGRVAIVTGAGNGLGKAYAILLASRGAKVVVNDLGGSHDGTGAGHRAADLVVDEIRAAGGEAVANYDSVTDGRAVVATAIDTWGRVDVVINNAGILRDTSFVKMQDSDWDLVQQVHLHGAYSVTRAAWEHMRSQNYGRIVMITSAAGIYGNFGQANYSAAKLGVVGFANSLAREGARRNIQVNTVAPLAASRMTATVLPEELLEQLKPEYVAPLVAYLVHESCEETGGLFEVGAGWVSKLRWQRSAGSTPDNTPEAIGAAWSDICQFQVGATHPSSTQESFEPIMTSLTRNDTAGVTLSNTAANDGSAVDVAMATSHPFQPCTFEVDDRLSCLYALCCGSAANPMDEDDLPFVYEMHNDGFRALPTMGVLYPFGAMSDVLEVPGLEFNPMLLLHGEQRIEIRRPLPTSGRITSSSRIANIYDKGKAALVELECVSRDEQGNELCVNTSTLFIRGIGGFGGPKAPAKPSNAPPQRAPDAVDRCTTTQNQALFYRLCGDVNPLHADPSMAAIGGFDRPILHGLCVFGIAGRAVLKAFGGNDPSRFRSMSARFAKPTYPGETIRTEMWREGANIILRCVIEERDEVCLSNAAVEITPESRL